MLRNASAYAAAIPAVAAGLLLAACSGGGGSGSGTVTAPSPTPTPTPAATVPGAPTIGTATAGNASASIAFTAPVSTGGSAITGYTATCTAGTASRTGTGTASPISVTGLTNGTAYACSVTAANAVGTSAASASVSVTPSASAVATSTAGVLCPYSGTFAGTYSGSAITARWDWTCTATLRSLSANGLPNHAVGTFPTSANPNAITAQTVSTSMTLTPALASASTSIDGPGARLSYALNGVKFDPGTAGTCPGSATTAANCNLANGTDTWRIEALGQSVFDFGVDANNAHVQPTGAYHYHGMPEGLLTAQGVSAASPRMTLVGWASDGFPVYARYCYSEATNAASAVKTCRGSYTLDTTADAGRPATSWVPLGAFRSDWNYVAGSGDLDDCNGRFGVTPEFPAGIYYYMITDSYPYAPRCVKGVLS